MKKIFKHERIDFIRLETDKHIWLIFENKANPGTEYKVPFIKGYVEFLNGQLGSKHFDKLSARAKREIIDENFDPGLLTTEEFTNLSTIEIDFYTEWMLSQMFRIDDEFSKAIMTFEVYSTKVKLENIKKFLTPDQIERLSGWFYIKLPNNG